MRSVGTLFFALIFVLTACGGTPFWLPKAHKIDIQQGNLLTGDQVNQVRPGLSREEVRSLLGEPVMNTGFGNDRWDYIYTRGEAGEHVNDSGLTVFFENDTVRDITHHAKPIEVGS